MNDSLTCISTNDTTKSFLTSYNSCVPQRTFYHRRTTSPHNNGKRKRFYEVPVS